MWHLFEYIINPAPPFGRAESNSIPSLLLGESCAGVCNAQNSVLFVNHQLIESAVEGFADKVELVQSDPI